MNARIFSPERLTLARQRRGLLVQELAVRVGKASRSVSAWENHKTTPTEENVAAAAKALDFPVEFFYMGPPPVLAGATFRSLARMTARQRNAAEGAGKQAVELDAWIDTHFTRPSRSLPDLRSMDPEIAAEVLRADWQLGYRVIPNLVHLLESKGVRVYSLVHDGVEVDAFSGWSENTPFIFLNTTKTPERSRMDAAHELGHLVLHFHASGDSKKHEDQAQAFAGAFLMPKEPFLATAPRRPTLATVIEAKRQWGVSAFAYTYRLYTAGIIEYWHLRRLCIELRSRFGATEPGHQLTRETSQVLAKVIGPSGSTRRQIADALHIPVKDLDDMTFGLTLTPMPGGGRTSPKMTHGGGESNGGGLKLMK